MKSVEQGAWSRGVEEGARSKEHGAGTIGQLIKQRQDLSIIAFH
jgi:hypothetical protein